MRSRGEAHMFYLAKEVGKIWRCSCWGKGSFIMINEFKYGQTWKTWPSPLSLSLYSTFNAGVPQGSILGPTLFLLYINDPLDDVICDIAIYSDDTTLCSKCEQGSDLWQQLELASELESDPRDTVDWGRKWLVDFNAGKTQLVSFDRSNNTGAIDVKMAGSVLEEKSSLKMLGLTFFYKLAWGSLHLLLKLPPQELEPWFVQWSFFLLMLLCISINLPYAHAWNTVVTSGLVPLVAPCNC